MWCFWLILKSSCLFTGVHEYPFLHARLFSSVAKLSSLVFTMNSSDLHPPNHVLCVLLKDLFWFHYCADEQPSNRSFLIRCYKDSWHGCVRIWFRTFHFISFSCMLILLLCTDPHLSRLVHVVLYPNFFPMLPEELSKVMHWIYSHHLLIFLKMWGDITFSTRRFSCS